jgi:hypothetical protein
MQLLREDPDHVGMNNGLKTSLTLLKTEARLTDTSKRKLPRNLEQAKSWRSKIVTNAD